MANLPQSLKRARQAEKRRRRNQGIGTKFRTMLKRARTNADNPDSARATFSGMQSTTDIAARKGIIHPRKAARLKKRLNSLIRKQAQASATSEKADAATGSNT